MECTWIKVYSEPIEDYAYEINPNTLYSGETIYIGISEIRNTEYEFVAWKDLNGNILGDDVIEPLENGMYKTTALCGGGFVAYVKTKQEEICLVLVECNPNEGSVQREEGYDVCGTTISISAVPECCYNFDRWSDSDVEHNTENPRNVLVMKGINTYRANFIEKEFNIMISANDNDLGTVTVSPNVVKCGENFTLTATPSDDCVFDYWLANDEQISTDNAVTIMYSCGEPTEFMAFFSRIPRYTITYYPGMGKTEIVDTFRMGDIVVYRTITDSDAIFLGWSFDPSSSTPDIEPGASGLFDYGDDIELYGVWRQREVYSIHYFGTPDDTTYVWDFVDDAYADDPLNLSTPTTPLDGYDFVGWIVVKHNDPYDPSNVPVTGQVTMQEGGLDAHSVWNENTTYSLKYIMNDHNNTIINLNNFVSGQNVIVNSPSELGFSYPYHYFVTWTGNGTTYNPGTIITFSNDDIILTASWTTNNVTLRYDISSADTGSITPHPVTVYSGQEVTLDDGSGIFKSGYTFGGWYGINRGFPLNSPITLISDMTVYPIWNKESRYTVTYNGKDCTATDTKLYASGDTVIVQNCGCVSQTGCKCSGWVDQNGVKHLNGSKFIITQNMVLSDYWDCCDVKIDTTDKTALLTINGTKVEWNTIINIDNDHLTFNVDTSKGCCFDGWFDIDTGLFLNPCDNVEIAEYAYRLIPGAYVSYIHMDNVKHMSDIEFINETNSPSLPYSEHLIIHNIDTGEYRQAVPSCGEVESYEFPCGGTVVAIIACNIFQETKRGEYEYVRHEGIFRTFYDFLNSLTSEETLYEHNIVNINGVDRYFEYIKCGR